MIMKIQYQKMLPSSSLSWNTHSQWELSKSFHEVITLTISYHEAVNRSTLTQRIESLVRYPLIHFPLTFNSITPSRLSTLIWYVVSAYFLSLCKCETNNLLGWKKKTSSGCVALWIELNCFHSIPINIWKIIYLNCGERCENMILIIAVMRTT